MKREVQDDHSCLGSYELLPRENELGRERETEREIERQRERGRRIAREERIYTKRRHGHVREKHARLQRAWCAEQNANGKEGRKNRRTHGRTDETHGRATDKRTDSRARYDVSSRRVGLLASDYKSRRVLFLPSIGRPRFERIQSIDCLIVALARARSLFFPLPPSVCLVAECVHTVRLSLSLSLCAHLSLAL